MPLASPFAASAGFRLKLCRRPRKSEPNLRCSRTGQHCPPQGDILLPPSSFEMTTVDRRMQRITSCTIVWRKDPRFQSPLSIWPSRSALDKMPHHCTASPLDRLAPIIQYTPFCVYPKSSVEGGSLERLECVCARQRNERFWVKGRRVTRGNRSELVSV